MRKLLQEFRGFAMSGNMLDLALGFIIGAAFAGLIESFAAHVLMQLIGAVFGQKDFGELIFTVNKAQIHYGDFLTDLVNFMMLAGLMFFVVKGLVWLGVGRARVFAVKDCPYCTEEVPRPALVCKFCRQPLVEPLPSLAQAQELFEREHGRRQLALPRQLPSLPTPVRRRGAEGPERIEDADAGPAAGERTDPPA